VPGSNNRGHCGVIRLVSSVHPPVHLDAGVLQYETQRGNATFNACRRTRSRYLRLTRVCATPWRRPILADFVRPMLALRYSAAVTPWASSRVVGRPCPLAVRPRLCLVDQS
jgi:hypothetical protein